MANQKSSGFKFDFLKNPFYCFILSFGIVLFIYSWGWSDLYPNLSTEVILFLSFTFIVSFFFGRISNSNFTYKDIQIDRRNYRRILFIYFCYIVEFLHDGVIPLLTIMKGEYYNYQDFGIPTFHILVQTLAPFYATYLYHQYLSSKNKILLFHAIGLISMSLLIISRGPVVTTCISCVILSLQHYSKIRTTLLIKIAIGFIIFFYGFGYVGNIRSFKDNEEVLLKAAKATDSFQNNLIPNEYFWLYLYAASPLANFQQVVDTSQKHSYNFWRYINNEIIPDIIGRRFDDIKKDPEHLNKPDYLIASFLTVGTMYFDSYIRMGWWGPIFAFLYYMGFILFYSWLLRLFRFTEKYRYVSIVILCTMSIFNTFDNMTREAGLLIQLVYPFVLGILDRIHIKNDVFNINFIINRFFKH